MKFIGDDRVYDPYFQYLDQMKGSMLPHIHEFASNTTHHNLTSPNSLHDSWIEYWRISEVVVGEKRSDRRIDIDACLLGPMHDRHIYLHYRDVRQHTITANNGSDYGDLLVHELTITADGVYVHELLFAGGAVFTVHFSDFAHRIELFKSEAPAQS
jgi:hypothetical protein